MTTEMDRRIDVGVLGPTGTVGQQIVVMLTNHPWFRLAWLGGSRSAGQLYGDVVEWRHATTLAPGIARLPIEQAEPGSAPRLLLSALDASVAGDIEAAFAQAGHFVVSNARNHRLADAVPLLVPEINADHLGLLEGQPARMGWPGRIVTNPNCSTVVLVMALAAIRQFKPRRVLVTTLQAASGAGRPGVPSVDLLGNVIPFIEGEEAKIETETRKILGSLRGDSIEMHPVVVSAQATRVPVVDGHLESVSIAFDDSPDDPAALIEAFRSFSGPARRTGLPTAPSEPLVYLGVSNRPQPRLDAERGGGMTVSVGRVRRCPVLDYKFVVLGHNAIRGAAGGAILNAELLVAEGWVD